MKSAKSAVLLFAALMLIPLFAPHVAQAAELTVAQPCSSTTPSCYSTIQAAIDAAVAGGGGSVNTVLVEPGTYAETITLNGITVRGRETARTILQSSVTASTAPSTISNMTFENMTSAYPIYVPSGAALTVVNNIFRVNTTPIFIAASASASTSIHNNVFYSNTTAISTAVDVEITNNVFLSNITAISPGVSLTQVTFNDFNGNSDDTTWAPGTNTNIIDNPQFVNASGNDFHLTGASAALINTGNTKYHNSFDSSSIDIGAYGGPDADTIPFIVSGVVSSSTGSDISLSWNANNSYLVTDYNVYYGTKSGDYTATSAFEGKSPILVPAPTTTATLSKLPIYSIAPGTPVLNQPEVSNQTLTLSWTAVDGATSYRVYYDVDDGTSTPPTTMIDVGNVTSYALTGLTNNTNYKIALKGVSQTTYYIAVTAVNLFSSGTSSPGISYESAYSTELSVNLGEALESGLSNIIVDYPEALVAYPNLISVHKGCFIATAAYGYYSAPEVQALRDFRDRYLITNSLGSAFVAWYYEHGPVGAAYLNAHPGFKPLVRAALLPAVGAATFMTQTSFLTKAAVLLLFGTIGLFILRKKITFIGGRR